MANQYYPQLSDVVRIENLPDILGFVKDGIDELFNDVYYKNLQFSKNIKGDSTFYSLDIVSGKKLSIELPGTGIFLVLNPDHQDYSVSSFPITVFWEWKILAYKREFNIKNFSFSVEDIFMVALDIFQISEEEALNFAINNFIHPSNEDISSLQQLVMDLNSFYGTSIPMPVPSEIPFDSSYPPDFYFPNEEDSQISNLLLNLNQQTNVSAYAAVFALYMSSGGLEKLNNFFSDFISIDLDECIKDFIFPKIRATLELSAGLEFPRNYLKPVYDAAGNNPYDPSSTGVPFEVIPQEGSSGYPKVVLTFGEALFSVDTEEGLGYNMDLILNTNVPAQIGNTGLIIDIQNLKIDLSDKKNFIEADLDGRPPEFMGVYTDYTAIILPKKWFSNVDNTTLQISGRNLLIGTGGISGTIALETVGGLPNNGQSELEMNIGSWKIGFSYFNLNFHQNVITESNIAGSLTIPKFKKDGGEAKIDLLGHINEEGDFNLTASINNGLQLTLFEFLTINILTVEMGQEDNNFYLGTSCQIWFENPIMKELLDGQIIEIPKLRIYDDGSIEIVGGNTFIPSNVSIDLGPVEIAVTGIHFGSTQLEYGGEMRKYNYWGFDGAMSLDPLGIDARGQGIKYYYTVDNDELDDNGDPKYTGGDNFLHIQSIEVDLIIPGTASPESAVAIIHGMLTLPEPGQPKEYVGEISIKLPKAKIAGGAAMKLQPRYPAFVIDAYIDLPAPIPIGPLGIYGFRGLLGFRYVAEKEAVGLVSGEDTWYDYYTYPPKGVHVSKFSGPERTEDYDFPFSIGAGAVLGTSFDSGTVISVRVMLLLSLPTLFLVEGRASILSARLGLDDNREPPFFAFLAWGDSSIEAGMGADFQVPGQSGWILDLYAEVQSGFFFNNPSAWYVNFGTRDVPISARVLTIITAQSYLMLSAQGIEAGARVSFELKKRFGPAKVHLYAYLEVGGYISFERPQIGGYIAAGGGIDVDIWIIAVSIGLDAIFSAEAAKPFLIYAELNVRGCVKILFAKVCKSFTVKLKWEKDKTVDRNAIAPLPNDINGLDRTGELVKGISMLTNESFDLFFSSTPPTINQIKEIIPLDTYIEFKAGKGLIPSSVSNKIGGYTFPPERFVDLVPPQKIIRGGKEIRQVKHKYSIENIELKAHNGSQWVHYHPFEALVKAADRPNVNNLKIGYWQLKEKQYDTVRLLATSPFTYMEAGEPGWSIPEIFGITPSTLFCSEQLRVETCSNVLNKQLGTKYYPPTQYFGHFINGAYFSLTNISGYELIDGQIVVVENEFMEVTNVENVHDFAKSLSFNNYNSMIVILPEVSVEVKLLLTTVAEGVTIKYYRSIINDITSIVEYELVHEEYKTATQLNSQITYLNENEPITKIIIEPIDPNNSGIATILLLLEQIAGLFEITYDGVKGEVTISDPKDVKLYNQLLEQLEKLKSKYCSGKENECNPDRLLCSLYEQLLALYEKCFIDTIKTIKQLLEIQKCLKEFNFLILDFNKQYPQYQLLNLLDLLYGLFARDLSWLNEALANPGDVSEEETILLYYELRGYAFDILIFIKNLGDCECENTKRNCSTSLQQLCWLTLEDHEWNQTIPGSEAIEEEYQLMIEGIQKTIQPIWRPNTSYYVKFTLKDEVDNGSGNSESFDYYYGFKTVGPLGHFHKNPEVDYIQPNAGADQYPLTSLRSYIDYNKSYPNADGNLLQAKPIFYSNGECKITIHFVKPMTYHHFNNWNEYNGLPELNGELHIAIKDPVTDVIIPYPLPIGFENETVPLPDGSDTWVDDDPRIPVQIQVLINMIKNGEIPCEIRLGDLIAPYSHAYTVTLTNLKPQKLYTALLYNAFEVSNNDIVSEPVHEFVFQTSRYPNFKSQVNSYLITEESSLEEKQAVYDINLALSNQAINKAYNIISNPDAQIGDPLENQYQHLFDRVLEGVLEITPLDPPETTEFNKIINKNTGKIVALLIRNPEPFNIPKIPLEIAQKMIQVTYSNGNVNGTYSVLHSKDYSQTIVMNNAKNITAAKLYFNFKYFEWVGEEYIANPINDVLTEIEINN